jgi:hypothetical protein
MECTHYELALLLVLSIFTGALSSITSNIATMQIAQYSLLKIAFQDTIEAEAGAGNECSLYSLFVQDLGADTFGK